MITPRASVVVVAFHRPDQLERLLRDLDHPAISLIVVNVEGDPAVSAAARSVTEIRTAVNVGYAAAVNLGVQAVATDVVVFTNDDVRVSVEAVSKLVQALGERQVDVVVPAVKDENGDLQRTIFALPTPRSLLLEWALLPDRPVPAIRRIATIQKWRSPTEVERIDAAAAILVATRTELLRTVPLPEDYFLYWEEMDWFWRLRDLSATVQMRPEATIVHQGGRSDVRPEKSRLLARNAVRCVRRAQGSRSAALALLAVVAWNARLVLVSAARVAFANRGGREAEVLSARVAGLRAALAAWREVA